MEDRRAHSILDCPEQIHTSPTRIFSRVTVLSLPPEVIVILAGLLLALRGLSEVIHLPSLFALVSNCWPAKETLILSPGLAHPQIGTWRSRCNTMPLPSTFGSLSSARPLKVRTISERQYNKALEFIMKNGFGTIVPSAAGKATRNGVYGFSGKAISCRCFPAKRYRRLPSRHGLTSPSGPCHFA